MAKNKKRAVPADLWLDRATEAQKEKMVLGLNLKLRHIPGPSLACVYCGHDTVREGDKVTCTVLAVAGAPRPPTVPLHPIPVLDNALPEGQRSVLWGVDDLDMPVAYVCERVKGEVDGGVPSYRLLKVKIERGVVVHVEAGVENLREIILQDIEDHILRDA